MKIKHILEKNSPQILVALGIGAMVGALVVAVKVTPKAHEELDELPEDTQAWDKVKTVAPIYAPAAGLAVVGVGCILTSQHILTSRYTALFALYSATEGALGRWQAATANNVTKKKLGQIEENAQPEPPPFPGNSLIPGEGDKIFLDTWAGRYFFAPSVEFIHRAVNLVNDKANREDFASLNDFYSELGIRTVDAGHELGWGSGGRLMEIDVIPRLVDDELQVIQISFKLWPRYTDELYGD